MKTTTQVFMDSIKGLQEPFWELATDAINCEERLVRWSEESVVFRDAVEVRTRLFYLLLLCFAQNDSLCRRK